VTLPARFLTPGIESQKAQSDAWSFRQIALLDAGWRYRLVDARRLANSAGAHIAAVLAFELDRVWALGTTAAVGIAEAAHESERRLFAGRR
jgi:hypothetical protein